MKKDFCRGCWQVYIGFLRNVGGCFSSVSKLGGHKLESYYI